jgi:SNF2 family DNA or RNA helicase
MIKEIIQDLENVKFIHKGEYVEVIFSEIIYNQLQNDTITGLDSLWMLNEFCKNEFYCVGKANKIENGYKILASDILSPENQNIVEVFMMPTPLKGSIELKPSGLNAATKGYKIKVKYLEQGKRIAMPYETCGYILKSRGNLYSLNTKQEEAFRIYREYEASINLNENQHYHLVGAFKSIQNENLQVVENRFKTLEIDEVEKVGLNITKLESGNLKLEPNLIGVDISDEFALKRELNHLGKEVKPSTLHIGKKLIQLDKKVSEGVKEIEKNDEIDKEEIEDFFENPGSYLDASKVDIDTGFSFRVQGISEFTRIEHGDFDSSENDWFLSGENITIENFEAYIKTEIDLDDFYKKALYAYTTKTKKIIFDGKEFKIPSKEELNIRIKAKREEIIQSSKDIEDSEDVLSNLKSNLSFDLKYFDENKSIADSFDNYSLDDSVMENLNIVPFEHQLVAIEWIFSIYRSSLIYKKIRGGIFADDMGLGKTFSALMGMKAIIEYETRKINTLDSKTANQEKSFLVVAPLSLLNNWKSEVDKFFSKSPFLDVVVLNSQNDLNSFRLKKGDKTNQFIKEGVSFENSKIQYSLKVGESYGDQRLDKPRRLILITYETLRNYQFSMARIPFSAVFFDEAQKIKNPNSLATRASKALNSDINILVTGTPVENNLEEYWCLMDTANPTLLGTKKEFKNNYIKPIKDSDDESLKIKIGKELYNNSGPFLLRRTKEELKTKLGKSLPDKVEYKGIKNSDFKYLSSLDKLLTPEQDQKFDEIRKNVSENHEHLKNLHRLKSCMLHPRLTFTKKLDHMASITSAEFWGESAKLTSLFETIQFVKNKQEKLIIFVISRNIQYLMKKWIKIEFGINPDIISGETKVESFDYDETRLGMIDSFSKKEGFNLIILSPLAAGVGLNVTAANHVFHLERHWNPAKEAQANDRAYRIGQEKEVSIYYPISKHPKYDSFDIKLDKLLSRKKFTKDVLMTYPRMTEKELADQIWK